MAEAGNSAFQPLIYTDRIPIQFTGEPNGFRLNLKDQRTAHSIRQNKFWNRFRQLHFKPLERDNRKGLENEKGPQPGDLWCHSENKTSDGLYWDTDKWDVQRENQKDEKALPLSGKGISGPFRIHQVVKFASSKKCMLPLIESFASWELCWKPRKANFFTFSRNTFYG